MGLIGNMSVQAVSYTHLVDAGGNAQLFQTVGNLNDVAQLLFTHGGEIQLQIINGVQQPQIPGKKLEFVYRDPIPFGCILLHLSLIHI